MTKTFPHINNIYIFSLPKTTNSSSNTNGITVRISQSEYARLLQNDVKYTDLKIKYEKKAKLIKTLQDSISYYKKKISSK